MDNNSTNVLKVPIDFAVIMKVKNANPNGDPSTDNIPRTTINEHGEISDVCIKHKVRNRLIHEGYNVYVQGDDCHAPGDKFRSLKDRLNSVPELAACAAELTKKRKSKDSTCKVSKEDFERIACETWIDVRTFGQPFLYGKSDDADGLSVSVTGPASIQPAISIEPVNITSTQITKSTNQETDPNNPNKIGSDRMGMKHRVDFGVYVTYGAIDAYVAQRTGFTEDDAEALKEAFRTLFRHDASSARPAGSMEVVDVVWWRHNCFNGQYSSAKVHSSLRVTCDEQGNVTVDAESNKLPGLDPEVIPGE